MELSDPSEEIRRKEKRLTRFKLAIPPLVLLFGIFISAIVLLFANAIFIVNVVPLILVMLGFVIIFFGAFYDFGANRYVNAMFQSKASLREKDVVQINREQLIMTLIFSGIGGLYILAGVILFYLIPLF
ncbi:MAG: hypothetical protein M1498_03440 [Candidatus Thermoplasmatota archaeon]|nr:hypothetical protein [Candidatus Thermoplasmatota archaeon]MCL5889205.1 hypothetical protein [Candidatus Thermoplasmatota archaeon]